jgi:type IX secretion system PorP/SprF family membrane protein
MASFAFHKCLGRNKNHYLSVGTQIGFTQRSLDIGTLYFADQFDGTGFSGVTQEIIQQYREQGKSRLKFFQPNLNLGLFWSAQFNKMLGAYAGVSMFNIIKPKDTFLKSDNERSYRFDAHAGMLIDINKFVLISPNGLYMFQAKAQQWIAGTSAAFNLSGKKEPYRTAVSVGVWYDGNGAVITSAGVSFSGLQIGISYDATIKKDLTKAVKTFGALEASIIYTGRPLDKKKQYSPLLCPQF